MSIDLFSILQWLGVRKDPLYISPFSLDTVHVNRSERQLPVYGFLMDAYAKNGGPGAA